jgi:exopolysaccharide biosynthesis polyprenyl glycosylphosphotransferase
LFTVLLLAGDTLALASAFWAAFLVRFALLPYSAPLIPRDYALLIAAVVPAWLVIFAAFQLYDPRYLFGGRQEYARAFNAILVGTLALVIFGFFQRDGLTVSRGWLALCWLLALLFVVGERFGLRRIVYALRRRGHLLAPALIVGANEEGQALAEQLRTWATSGLYLVGFADDSRAAGSHVLDGYRVLGGLADLEHLVAEGEIEELIVAPTALNREQLLEIFRAFGAHPAVNLRLSSGLFEIMTTGLQIEERACVPLISVSKARIGGLDAVVKRMLEVGLIAPGLILIAPLLAVTALAIRLDSPGPVIYRRRVMGAGGREFDAFKFRTMFINGDEILAAHPQLKAQLENNCKLRDDPRVTRVGKVLRRYSLDELPQLLNVLAGEMSLVGPRMISPPEMAKYGRWGMNLLTVKPGLTGLWQISGRADVSYQERVRMDMHYIRNWTIWLDLQILFQTIPAVLRGRGAY